MTAASTRRISIDPITRLEGHGKIENLPRRRGRGGQGLSAASRSARIREVRRRPTRRGDAADHEPHLRRYAPARTTWLRPRPWTHCSTWSRRRRRERSARSTTTSISSKTICSTSISWAAPISSSGPTRRSPSATCSGVIDKVGVETGKRVIEIRHRARELIGRIAGRAIHPVLGLPGGVSKRMTPAIRDDLRVFAKDAIAFARFTADGFRQPRLEEFRLPRSAAGRRVPVRELLHGNGRSAGASGLLRREGPRGGPGGERVRHLRSEGLRQGRRRACGALDLREVPLSARGGLEGAGGRASIRHVPRGPGGPA